MTNRNILKSALVIFLSFSLPVFAASEGVARGANVKAIGMFMGFVMITLFITYWAAKRIKSRKDFYAAGGNINSLQNGLAIAGDYMSAATFLGITAITFSFGIDSILYILGATVAWVVVFFLIAERLRNLGRYTFADAVAYRLDRIPIRTLSALGTLCVVIPYLLAQMVGAGALIQLLFNLPYSYAVIIVGVLMMIYVAFGGMLATTWVQIIKAVLLVIGGTVIAVYVLYQFGFSIEALASRAVDIHAMNDAIMRPGGRIKDPITGISLGMAFIFGTAGLPHILMRFFTVPDGKAARQSVVYSTCIIAYFMTIILVIGLGAIVFVTGRPEFLDESGQLIGGANLAPIHLSYVVGGDYFLGFISAVAFATILAVVSGLSLSAASAISHDLYACVFRNQQASEKEEVLVSRITVVLIGIIAISLSIMFEKENVAFLAVLALAIAASVNFPVLFLSMYWKGTTTRGTVIGGTMGLATAMILVILSPTIWVKLFGFDQAIFPYSYPTLFSVTTCFIGIWFFSVTDRSKRALKEKDAFNAQLIRSQLGVIS